MQNFDHPGSLDFDLLIKHLSLLKQQKSVELPNYDFLSHTREDNKTKLIPHEIIIVEGILIFQPEKLRNLFDIKFFINAPIDVAIIRRIHRDIKERGRNLPLWCVFR